MEDERKSLTAMSGVNTPESPLQNHRSCFPNASTSMENTEDRAWGVFAENVLHQVGDR